MAEPRRRLKVVHFHRHPAPTAHSLERVFATVRAHLPDDIEAIPRYCPRPSTGIVNRIITEKTLNWLFENATKVAPASKTEEPAG